MVEISPNTGHWRHYAEPVLATAAASRFKPTSGPGKYDFGLAAAAPLGKLSPLLAETIGDGGCRTTFPWSDTFIHTATVELAGKPSLSNKVVVVSKDQMNYLSQDASRRVKDGPQLSLDVLGK